MATGHVRDVCIFPVGFIVQLTTDVDPAEYFGGKWQRIKGHFLLAADDTYPAGSTGGEAEHTLTVDEMPSHRHNLYGALTGKNEAISNTGNNWAQTTTGWDVSKWIKDTGGGQPHNNMPPYRSVYIWERIG